MDSTTPVVSATTQLRWGGGNWIQLVIIYCKPLALVSFFCWLCKVVVLSYCIPLIEPEIFISLRCYTVSVRLARGTRWEVQFLCPTSSSWQVALSNLENCPWHYGTGKDNYHTSLSTLHSDVESLTGLRVGMRGHIRSSSPRWTLSKPN